MTFFSPSSISWVLSWHAQIVYFLWFHNFSSFMTNLCFFFTLFNFSSFLTSLCVVESLLFRNFLMLQEQIESIWLLVNDSFFLQVLNSCHFWWDWNFLNIIKLLVILKLINKFRKSEKKIVILSQIFEYS
jgi:hypothetical protein